MSVYKVIRRMKQPDGRQGPWKPQEISALKKAVKKLGRSWVEVAKLVGRTPDDCRDRWRADESLGTNKVSGPWSDADVEKLREGVEKFGENWQALSDWMGTRNPKQINDKWYVHFSNSSFVLLLSLC